MLLEFYPVFKENFSPANSDMLRSLTTCAEKGMFRPGEIAPPKEKTTESSLYCIIKVKGIKVDAWPNYRYLTADLKMHKTNHDHAVEQLVTIPVPQDSHIRAPITRLLKRIAAKQALRMNVLPGTMTVPELLACCDRPIFEWDYEDCDSKPKPVIYSELVEITKHTLTILGYDHSKYNEHSFRIGGATDLAALGVPRWKIMLLGRWKSLSSMVRYTRISSECIYKLHQEL